jgi:hypothetical protein
VPLRGWLARRTSDDATPSQARFARQQQAVVLVVVVTGLLWGVASVVIDVLERSRANSLVSMTTQSVPTALLAIYANNGSLYAGLTDDQAIGRQRLRAAGVPPTSPVGGEWVVSAPPTPDERNTITLEFRVNSGFVLRRADATLDRIRKAHDADWAPPSSPVSLQVTYRFVR